MLNNIVITDEERKLFLSWTALDEDLAEAVLRSRLDFARGDLSRTDYWHDPEGIDVFEDVPYVDDGTRAHRLDLYLPHDSVVRGGKTTPVYIDIHGGGFVYAYKELNRNFCTNLAKLGFAGPHRKPIFSDNWRTSRRHFVGSGYIDTNIPSTRTTCS